MHTTHNELKLKGQASPVGKVTYRDRRQDVVQEMEGK